MFFLIVCMIIAIPCDVFRWRRVVYLSLHAKQHRAGKEKRRRHAWGRRGTHHVAKSLLNAVDAKI